MISTLEQKGVQRMRCWWSIWTRKSATKWTLEKNLKKEGIGSIDVATVREFQRTRFVVNVQIYDIHYFAISRFHSLQPTPGLRLRWEDLPKLLWTRILLLQALLGNCRGGKLSNNWLNLPTKKTASLTMNICTIVRLGKENVRPRALGSVLGCSQALDISMPQIRYSG